jgi:hypothetical protein
MSTSAELIKFGGVLKQASALEATPSPSTEPFKNAYKAREILANLCKEHPIVTRTAGGKPLGDAPVESERGERPDDELSLESAIAHLRLGRNFSVCEEASSAEQQLSLIATTLDHTWFESQLSAQRAHDAQTSADGGNQEGVDNGQPATTANCTTDELPTGVFATVLMATYKHLAAIWASRIGQETLATKLLRRALLTHTNQSPERLPNEIATYTMQPSSKDGGESSSVKVVDEDSDPDKILPYLHFFLAQVLMSSDCDEAMKFCLLTLRASPCTSFEEVSQWVSSATSVVKYFIDRSRFREANKCWLAASHVLRSFREQSKVDGTTTDTSVPATDGGDEEGKEGVQHSSTCVGNESVGGTHKPSLNEEETEALDELQANLRCQCGELYLRLLCECMAGSSSDATDVNATVGEQAMAANSDDGLLVEEVDAILTGLGISAPDDPLFERNPTALFHINQTAASIFKRGFYALEKAKQVYELDGYVTKHVEIIKQQSSFYCKLAEADADPKRRATMQGRRIKLLDPIAKALNPAVYAATLQEILYDLVQASAAKVQEQQLRVTVRFVCCCVCVFVSECISGCVSV